MHERERRRPVRKTTLPTTTTTTHHQIKPWEEGNELNFRPSSLYLSFCLVCLSFAAGVSSGSAAMALSVPAPRRNLRRTQVQQQRRLIHPMRSNTTAACVKEGPIVTTTRMGTSIPSCLRTFPGHESQTKTTLLCWVGENQKSAPASLVGVLAEGPT